MNRAFGASSGADVALGDSQHLVGRFDSTERGELPQIVRVAILTGCENLQSQKVRRRSDRDPYPRTVEHNDRIGVRPWQESPNSVVEPVGRQLGVAHRHAARGLANKRPGLEHRVDVSRDSAQVIGKRHRGPADEKHIRARTFSSQL